jgi:hypothetical protein
MIGTENFLLNERNYCDSTHLRGNIDGFSARRESGNNISKHRWVTLRHLCTKCRPIVGSAVSAGPRGPATWTDTEGFFSCSGPHLTPPGSDPWYVISICMHCMPWNTGARKSPQRPQNTLSGPRTQGGPTQGTGHPRACSRPLLDPIPNPQPPRPDFN